MSLYAVFLCESLGTAQLVWLLSTWIVIGVVGVASTWRLIMFCRLYAMQESTRDLTTPLAFLHLSLNVSYLSAVVMLSLPRDEGHFGRWAVFYVCVSVSILTQVLLFFKARMFHLSARLLSRARRLSVASHRRRRRRTALWFRGGTRTHFD